jgi:GNAT superfamily N-acetyltransferase
VHLRPVDVTNAVDIIDLPHGSPAWDAALPVLRELRPALDRERLDALLEDTSGRGPRFIGAVGDGAVLGVAGYRTIANTSNGKKLYVDDLITTAGHRQRGVGAALLAELVQRARVAGCTVLDLDSGVQRFPAHRFYLGQGMSITAHHFTVDVRS